MSCQAKEGKIDGGMSRIDRFSALFVRPTSAGLFVRARDRHPQDFTDTGDALSGQRQPILQQRPHARLSRRVPNQ